MRTWQRSRSLKCVAACVAVCLAWGCFPQSALAGDEPFTPDEERAILEAVEGNAALRAENAALDGVVRKDAILIEALRQQVAIQQRLIDSQDKMLAMAAQISGLQEKAGKTWQDLAATERTRADRSEEKVARLEKAQAWSVTTGVVGVALAVLGGFLAFH